MGGTIIKGQGNLGVGAVICAVLSVSGQLTFKGTVRNMNVKDRISLIEQGGGNVQFKPGCPYGERDLFQKGAGCRLTETGWVRTLLREELLNLGKERLFNGFPCVFCDKIRQEAASSLCTCQRPWNPERLPVPHVRW